MERCLSLWITSRIQPALQGFPPSLAVADVTLKESLHFLKRMGKASRHFQLDKFYNWGLRFPTTEELLKQMSNKKFI
jgi:hypothetical protein